MTTRADVVAIARSQLGYLDDTGFNVDNKYSATVGFTAAEAYCADFYTWCFLAAGVPLPSMQRPGHTGFSGVPEGENYSRAHGAWRPSWLAEPADGIAFCFDGSGVAAHIEMVVSLADGVMTTIGANSLPDGGVNQHTWSCPDGVGNPEMLGAINAAGLVTFTPQGGFLAMLTDAQQAQLAQQVADLHEATFDNVDDSSPDKMSGAGIAWALNQCLVLLRAIAAKLNAG